MALQQTVENTVRGLGFELVELERSAGGLLRVTIDHPWEPGQGPAALITLDDCERVTRQLQYVLEVEGVDYRRMEVSSPGVDRPLHGERDFERFEGEQVDLVLREPIGAVGAGVVHANRKRFRGRLARDEQGGWQLIWSDTPAPKPGQRPAGGKRRAAEPAPEQVLGFELHELQSARLAPDLDFKGRRGRDGRAPRAGNK